MAFRRRRKPSSHPRCAWTVQGWTCRYRVAEVLVNGTKVRCRFCSGHQCMKNEGGMPCGIATVAGLRFCHDHNRCTAVGEGGRCGNYVKGMDANKYRYCAQLHNCSTEDCIAQRATHPETETDLRYCPTHRCPQPTCRREKVLQGPHCATHTCAGLNCFAFCTGGGNPGSPTLYCDRHRVCGAESCVRLCHIRENGVVAAHCGLHYCRAEGCERERHADETCTVHACAEQGCGRRKNDEVEGVFCKSHECKGRGCYFRRRRGDWCAEHVCARRRCEGEAGENEYCARHQLCVVVGCEKYRAITGDHILDRCDDHEAAACASTGCTTRAAPSRLFCPVHLCATPGCPSAVSPPMTLCSSHKCALSNCAAPCWLSPTVALPSRFCAQHACHYPSCGEMAEAGTQRCPEHTRCRSEGCGRCAERGEGYCSEHRRGGYPGYQGQWANWGVAI